MSRISSTISPSLVSYPSLLAQANLIEKAAEPVVKAGLKPALQGLERAFAREVLRRAGSKIFLRMGGGIVARQFVLSELASSMGRVAAPQLASPSTMLFLIGGMHVGELTVQQICVRYGLSLAAIAASAVAEEQARRSVKIHPIGQFSDAVMESGIYERAVLEKRLELQRKLKPIYERELAAQNERNKAINTVAPQAIQKTKPSVYKPVPKVAKLPVEKPLQVPNVLPIPQVQPQRRVGKVSPLPKMKPAQAKIKLLKFNINIAALTKTKPQKQPSSNVQKATDENQDNLPQIASRTVVYIGKNIKGEDELVGNSTYIKIDPKHPEKTENAVINRLVHRAPVQGHKMIQTGHDAIHLISGFGINPKAATSVGVPFPMTGIDAEKLGLNPPNDQQKGLNGILHENITNGLYYALKDGRILDRLEAQIQPKELRPYASRILEDLNIRTNITNKIGIKSNEMDLKRQASELLGLGLGRVLDVKETSNPRIKQDYIPSSKNTSYFITEFNYLFEKNVGLRAELRRNMFEYLQYVAQAEYNKAHNYHNSVQPIELNVSPQSTNKLISAVIRGLEKIHEKYPTRLGFPDPVLELIHFYEKLLRGDKNPTPTVVLSPKQTEKTA